jgi:DNA (cytosine-5)-methyltransferase 1
MWIVSCTDARFAGPVNLTAQAAAFGNHATISKIGEVMSSRPTAVHLYSGVGGMSLGFEQAGFNIAAAVDIEQNNVETHKKNFPECNSWQADLSLASGDQIRKETEIGDKRIDVLFAGPPCQGFSLIGKREQNDPRNLLIVDLARLISELNPSYFVVENVEGILLKTSKKTLDEFVNRTIDSGYSVVQPIRVLDAAEFGVPQRRRRLFVLGYRIGLAAPAYPKPTHPYDEEDEPTGPTVWDAISDLPRISSHEYLLEDDSYDGPLLAASAYAEVLRGDRRDPKDKSPKRTTNGAGLGGCLRTLHSDKIVKRFDKTEQGKIEKISRFYRLAKNGLAPTLRAGTGPAQGSFMAPRPIHPFQNRCITVREAARLHSFPDWFYFHPTKWHGFRQVGNSVPPLLARAVGISVLKALRSNKDS